MKIGLGYDIHRLTDGRKLILGGVSMGSERGPVAHSDGDVLLHAVCDAILGALGKGDIGMHFPDTDDIYKGISSEILLKEVVSLMTGEGYEVGNLDSTIVMEQPRISPYREKITEKLSDLLRTDRTNINLKGKTKEKLDSVGEGKAVEAYAVVLLKEKL